MGGVFAVLFIIFLLIRGLIKVFPEKQENLIHEHMFLCYNKA